MPRLDEAVHGRVGTTTAQLEDVLVSDGVHLAYKRCYTFRNALADATFHAIELRTPDDEQAPV